MSSAPTAPGPLTPVTEEVTAFDLPVTGALPPELNGRYLRIGPNALGVEDPAVAHWMQGDGMVHGVRLREGRAEWYRNRWVRSVPVRQKLGEPAVLLAPRYGVDFACNTHVIGHAGRTYALTEGEPSPQELGYELDTVGTAPLAGSDPGFTAPAHTKLDPRNGELHCVSYLSGVEFLRHTVLDAAGRITHTRDIPTDGQPMVHDFALTEHHVVIYDSPIAFSTEAMARGSRLPFAWLPDRPSRIAVMPRAGGDVRWFPVSPCFPSHTLNAYDDGPLIVVDLMTFPAGFDMDRMRADRYGALERWTVDLTSGTVTERRLDDRPQEFPRVNEAMVSRHHRYGYSAATGAMFARYVASDGPPPDAAFVNALIKHDLRDDRREVHHFGADAAVGEAVFAPADGAADPPAGDDAEDDGYLMAYAHNIDRGAADLVVLSAKDFRAAPLARVHLPRRVPLGLHGSWIPDA